MQKKTKTNERKSIEELNLIDDFMFTEASTDEETAELLFRIVIERATGLKVGKLIIEPQKTVNGIDLDHRGIRMDVSVREKNEKDDNVIQLFDVEPNNVKKVHLPKRSRFYQALIDVKVLETGVEYDKMPDMWSIWILPYDPFGKDYMLYSVKNVVEDFPEIDYNDGVRKLFLYTDGKNGGSDALKKLLKYIRYSKEENAVDEELKKLHSNVKRIKSRKEIGVKYMQMQEIIKYTVEEAVEEAVKETAELTEQRMGKLTEILLAEKRYDDLQRMATDSEYRKKLLEEISEE